MQGSSVLARYDYLPFGERIGSGINGRSSLYGSTGSMVITGQDQVVEQQFTGKERDAESGLDYFGARFFMAPAGRFASPDPLMINPLRITVINPQRWNAYSYAVNNPLFFVDPDGRDAVAVNLRDQVPLGGHQGIASVHADGRAQYARFGSRAGGKPFGPGEVKAVSLSRVQFGPNGLPTDASYRKMAEEIAAFEGQDPATVRMNYFKTTEAETIALDEMIRRNREASGRGQAPEYDVTQRNCATFCIAGLVQSGVVDGTHLSLIPNRLFELLLPQAVESYAGDERSPKEEVTSKLCTVDDPCK